MELKLEEGLKFKERVEIKSEVKGKIKIDFEKIFDGVGVDVDDEVIAGDQVDRGVGG